MGPVDQINYNVLNWIVSGKKFSVSKLTEKSHNDMQYCRQLIKDRNMSNVNLIYDSNIKFAFW